MEQCKIIAIANQKGGVGKTTTTVNLDCRFYMQTPGFSFASVLLSWQSPSS